MESMAAPHVPAPNAEFERLRETVETLQRKVKDLEDRPILREEKFIESAPKWLQAVVGLATLILVLTLSWSAVQLYSLNGDMRALQADVRALDQRLGGVEAALRDQQQSLIRIGDAVARLEARLGSGANP